MRGLLTLFGQLPTPVAQSRAFRLFSEKPSLLNSLDDAILAQIAAQIQAATQTRQAIDEEAILSLIRDAAKHHHPLDYQALADGNPVTPAAIIPSIGADAGERRVLEALADAVAAYNVLVLPPVDNSDRMATHHIEVDAARAETLLKTFVAHEIFAPRKTVRGGFTLVRYTLGRNNEMVTDATQHGTAADLYRHARAAASNNRDHTPPMDDATLTVLAAISVDPVASGLFGAVLTKPAAADAAGIPSSITPLRLTADRTPCTLHVHNGQLIARGDLSAVQQLVAEQQAAERADHIAAITIARAESSPRASDDESADAGVGEYKRGDDEDIDAEAIKLQQQERFDFFAHQQEQARRDEVVAKALDTGFQPRPDVDDMYDAAADFLDRKVALSAHPRLRR